MAATPRDPKLRAREVAAEWSGVPFAETSIVVPVSPQTPTRSYFGPPEDLTIGYYVFSTGGYYVQPTPLSPSPYAYNYGPTYFSLYQFGRLPYWFPGSPTVAVPGPANPADSGNGAGTGLPPPKNEIEDLFPDMGSPKPPAGPATIPPVPEPGAYLLLSAGLAGLWSLRRYCRRG